MINATIVVILQLLSLDITHLAQNGVHEAYIPSFLVRILDAWKVKVFLLSLVLGGWSTQAGRTRLANNSCLAFAWILRWLSVKEDNMGFYLTFGYMSSLSAHAYRDRPDAWLDSRLTKVESNTVNMALRLCVCSKRCVIFFRWLYLSAYSASLGSNHRLVHKSASVIKVISNKTSKYRKSSEYLSTFTWLKTIYCFSPMDSDADRISLPRFFFSNIFSFYSFQ